MSEVVGEAVINVRTDESGVDVAGAGARAGEGYSKGFASHLKGLAVAIGGALAARKVLDFAKESVAEARESQKVGAATTAILKSTGQAANLTADQVSALATAQSNKTGVDDEAIQAGENLLLTFTKVRNEVGKGNDVFTRATKAGQDLAAAGFGSISGNAVQLGKALQDPIKGISALARSGVTFSDSQKETIKQLVASGDLLSAQKVILSGVEEQVGGTAEATATYGEKAAVTFGNVKEAVGTALLPVLDAVEKFFVDKIGPAIFYVLGNTSRLRDVFDEVRGVFDKLTTSVGGGSSFASVLQDVIPRVVATVRELLPSLEAVGRSIAANFIPVLRSAANTFTTVVLPAVLSVVDYLRANVIPIITTVASIFATQVIPAIAQVAQFFYTQVYPAVVAIAIAVGQRLKPVFDQLFTTFQTRILPTVQKLIVQFRTQLFPALQPIIKVVIQVIGFLLKLAAAILGKVLPPLIRLAGFILSKVLPAIVTIITKVAQFIGFIIRLGAAIGGALGRLASFQLTLNRLVRNGLSAVLSAIGSLPGKVLAFGGKLLSAGADLIKKLLTGMGNAAKGVGGLIGNIASGVGNAIADAARAAINNVIDAFNRAVPDKIGVGKVSVDLPDNPIPHLAIGTGGFTGGVAYVGEQGPERVVLPAGARVYNARRTRAMDSADTAALLSALTAAVASIGNRPTVSVTMPTNDAEAVASAIINRLAYT